jgi:hypothetical protein
MGTLVCNGETHIFEGPERRILNDGRRESTPGSSRYAFWDLKKDFQPEGKFVYRYNSTVFFFVVSAVALNVLDSFLTIMILDMRGWEINPVVQAVITLHGEKFWIWKFAVVSVALVLLSLHSQFKRVKIVIVSSGFFYFTVVLYQIFLLCCY